MSKRANCSLTTEVLRTIVAFVGKDTLISGGADGQLILWDMESKEQRRRLAAHSDALTSLAVSPGGRSVASGGLDKSIKIWMRGRRSIERLCSRKAVVGDCKVLYLKEFAERRP